MAVSVGDGLVVGWASLRCLWGCLVFLAVVGRVIKMLGSQSNFGELMKKFEEQALFKQQVSRDLNSCRSLVWALDSFTSAREVARLLKHYHIKEKNEFALSSFLKTIISEYAKIFATSRNNYSRSGFSDKYLFKSSSFKNQVHDEIMELRNLSVAHSEEKLEPQLSVILLTRIASPQPKRTMEDAVYLPLQFIYKSSSLWFTRNTEWIDKILAHLDACCEITQKQLEKASSELQVVMMQNARWCASLDSCYIYDNTHGGDLDTDLSVFDFAIEPEIKLKSNNKTFDFRGLMLEVNPKISEPIEGAGYTVNPDPSKPGVSYRVVFDDKEKS